MTAPRAPLMYGTRGRRVLSGVRARLFGSYAALLFVLLVGLSAAFSSTQVLRANFTHTVNTVDALATAVDKISKLLDDQETGLRGYFLTGDARFLQPYNAATRALPALNQRTDALLRSDPAGRALFTAMRRDQHAWEIWAVPYLRQPPTRPRASPAFLAGTLRGKALFDSFRRSSDRLTAYLATRRARDLQQSLDAAQRIGGILFWVLIGTVVLVAVVAWLTTRGIMRALGRLAAAAMAVGRGQLDTPIAVAGPNEIAWLGQSMEHMRSRLYAQREMAEILGSSLHLQSIWTRFAEMARTQVPFDQISLGAVDDEGRSLTRLYVEGGATGLPAGGTALLTTTMTGLVPPTQQCLILPDLAALPPDQRRDDVLAALREGLHSLAIVPLRVQGRLVGSLILADKQPHAFTEDLLGPILALAPLVGAAMENARLYASLDVANSALARANEVKSAFLASVSHELRTPLNAIIGFSEVLQDCTFGPLNERQQRYVGNVLEGGRHQLRLVNDILDLSKVEAGRLELHLEDFDLHAVLREATQTVQPLALRNGIALVTEVNETPLLAYGDRHRTMQILYNLLSNALKFTPAGGSVRVSRTILPRAIGVAVEDTGIGIAPEDHERIFEEFSQVDTRPMFSQQGTGLGLALTRRLVELQGGAITVVSSPGHGSTFTFTLPRAREQIHDPGANGDVLVVEDHPPAQDLLRLYLGEAGYGVQVVQDLDEVVPRAIMLHPVAITMDLLVGEDTAWPVLRRLKSSAETKDIPVVIVSVVDDGQATGFALGAADYLVKPVSRHAIQGALHRVLGSRQPARVLAVDDDPAALEMVALALEGGPFVLSTAASGAEALALLQRQPPDVLIVDLMMAPMSGFDLIAALAAGELTSTIPIIVLTARDLTTEDIARLNGSIAVALSKTGLQKEHLMRELRRALRANQMGAMSHAMG